MASIAACRIDKESLAVAHVNFHLRGEESDGDEKFVKSWGKANGIKVYSTGFDTKHIAGESGISIEMAARELRYEWFRTLAEKEGFTYLAVAHNANDNAETLLLNIARGTGYSGLKGILPKRSVELKDGRNLLIIRPLLWAQRSEIENYARSNGIQWRTDRTNSCNDYARNKIRNMVIPLLSEINPAIIQTLNRETASFYEAGKILDKSVDEVKRRISVSGIPGKDYLGLRKRYLIEAFNPLPVVSDDDMEAGRQHAFIIESLLKRYGMNSSTAYNIIDSIRTAAAGSAQSAGTPVSTSTKVFHSAGHTAVMERGLLKIYKGTAAGRGKDKETEEVLICGPGKYKFGEFTLEIKVSDVSDISLLHKESSDMLLDADKAGFPLVCRKSRPGDRFRPFGMRGEKSVADFLNGKKVDYIFKPMLPVLTLKDSRIIALPGIEISDCCKITPLTKRIMSLGISI